MPRENLLVERRAGPNESPRTALAAFFADRRDAKALRGLIARFDKLTHADWDELDRLAEVFALADRVDASHAVRAALRNHPPVREAIEANPSSSVVRAFLA